MDEDKAGPVAERLMAPDMFSGWGIRTLSSEHPAYNPFAYHLGSVWPSPNSIAAYGLKRYGFDAAMHAVAGGLFAASQIFDLDRLPEVFGGHPRDERHPHPGLYPGACSPQAWSAGAVILLVNTMLGFLPLAPRQTLIVDPSLPKWLPEITMRNIRVGPSCAGLKFRRDASGHTEVEVLEAGGLHIRRLPPRDAAARKARIGSWQPCARPSIPRPVSHWRVNQCPSSAQIGLRAALAAALRRFVARTSSRTGSGRACRSAQRARPDDTPLAGPKT